MADAPSHPAAMTPRLTDRAAAWIRAHGLRAAAEIAVNFVAPFLLFRAARAHLGDAGALMAASAAPIGWSLYEFIRSRRIDALSVIVLAGIGLSLLAFLGGGGVRFLQLREQLVTGLIGLVFLGSAAINRPLVYYLARARLHRAGAEGAARFNVMGDSDVFRRAMGLATLVWGVGLTLECALACALVFLLTIPQFLAASPILGTTWVLALTGWTYWYVRRRVLPLFRAPEESEPRRDG